MQNARRSRSEVAPTSFLRSRTVRCPTKISAPFVPPARQTSSLSASRVQPSDAPPAQRCGRREKVQFTAGSSHSPKYRRLGHARPHRQRVVHAHEAVAYDPAVLFPQRRTEVPVT